jgi:bifunctional non-homologous end joining protein LigD
MPHTLVRGRPPAVAAATLDGDDLMHAVRYPRPFTAEGWLFEEKLDGIRVLARKANGRTELLSRSSRSLDEHFPEVVEALAWLPDGVVDGQLVLFDAAGLAVRERLRRRTMLRQTRLISLASLQEPAVFCAFDLLLLEDRDLRTLPLAKRKAALRLLLPSHPRLRFVEHVATRGEALYATAVEHGHEGVVAKKADAPYKAGRQPTWRKIGNPGYQRHDAPEPRR